MKTYSAASAAEVYRHQLLDLLEAPEVVVRGLPTRELLNVVTEIANPRHRFRVVPGRRANPWIVISEALWMLAGRDDVAALLPYNKRIAEFSDDGEHLYGAYGARIGGQIPALLERLRKESTDRRAVLAIWRPEDLTAETKDPPCNTQLLFKIRNGALHMTVVNRSNDLHWGLHAVNLPVFGILQEYLAWQLKARLGTQTHLSQSLHIYTEGPGQKITEKMLAALEEPLGEVYTSFSLFPESEEAIPHEEYASLAGHVLDGTYPPPGTSSWIHRAFLVSALEFLGAYHTSSREIAWSRIPWDWVLAAQAFRGEWE